MAFWETEWLIEQIASLSITLEQWDSFRSGIFESDRERALACLFLNRTSFSGIMSSSAGPIGGRSQSSKYKIDCRFPVETLSRRLRQVGELREKVVFVECADWRETLDKVRRLGLNDDEVFLYLDPPFYEKSDRLYRFHFGTVEHEILHDTVVALKQNWLLSYDPAKVILDMYSHDGVGPKHVDLLYSTAGSQTPFTAKELIITNLANLPVETRLWRSSEEWCNSTRSIGRKCRFRGAGG